MDNAKVGADVKTGTIQPGLSTSDVCTSSLSKGLRMRTDLLFHPEIEMLSRRDMRVLQKRKWAKQWAYISSTSTFYQRKLGKTAAKSMTLDDLQDVPLTEKEELRQSQELDSPLGDYVACSQEMVTRLHRTSGTTGRPLILANSKRDTDIIAEQGARGNWASGLRPANRVVHCLNYQMWTGGVTDHMSLEATGATVLPYGVGGTKRLISVIRELGIDAIFCTPSYPALLEKVLRETSSMAPRELGLRLGLFAGEAGLDNQEFRQALGDTWGFKVRNACYGLSEVMSTLGSQCEHTNDLHFLSSDVLFPELLDPLTGVRIGIEDGTTGELVCTHLQKECQPLIRYRTRDVVTITGTDRCQCGRSLFRFRITGRTDDMFNVRGVNVFPTAIQTIIIGAGDIASGQFRILMEGPGPYDRIKLRVEAPEHMERERWAGASHELEIRIRETIGASADVEMVAFESLPRTGGKTSLVERS